MLGELDKQEAHKLHVLGLLLSGLSQHECAAELFRMALIYDSSLVAARVHLGITYGHMDSYDEMLQIFTEAIRIDPIAARIAPIEEPEEVGLINRMLVMYPAVETRPWVETMPREFVEAGDLTVLGRRHVFEGKYVEAVEALERSLEIDPTFPVAVAVLSFAYLLLRETVGGIPTNREKSVLWGIEPTLAKRLFAQ
jgi:tetratricopeptide (TPR) repeat protein